MDGWSAEDTVWGKLQGEMSDANQTPVFMAQVMELQIIALSPLEAEVIIY